MKTSNISKEYSTLQEMNTDKCTMLSGGWLIGSQYDLIPDNGLIKYVVEYWR